MIVNKDPFTDEVIHKIASANSDDLDRAYRSAQRAQQEWGNMLPAQQQEVLDKAAAILTERKDEIVDLLVKEGGSTVVVRHHTQSSISIV
jgi:aldehyde dehydrogenase (NAD+)